MNLHFVDDNIFINGAIQLFEKYAPSQNIFIVNSDTSTVRNVVPSERIIVMRLMGLNNYTKIKKIVEDHKINFIYVHFLRGIKAVYINKIKENIPVKTFWIFYGADLYDLLYRDYGYQLYDAAEIKKYNPVQEKAVSIVKKAIFYAVGKTTEKEAIMKFIGNLDYFCFWNTYDFELLKKYYKTGAAFIPFLYFNALSINHHPLSLKRKIRIVINNSASPTGNHITLLNKIHQIDTEQTIEKLIVPLSYGNQVIREQTLKLGTQLFGDRFNPLVEFMPKDAYFKLFEEVSVAFFGARRQEAAGNIFQLLDRGVKIFLRNDNNMIDFLRDKGYRVFSFEDDLNTCDDLLPLSGEEIKINQRASLNFFREYDEIKVMEGVLNP